MTQIPEQPTTTAVHSTMLHYPEPPKCPHSAICFWKETLSGASHERAVRKEEASRWRRRAENAEARAETAEEESRKARARTAVLEDELARIRVERRKAS